VNKENLLLLAKVPNDTRQIVSHEREVALAQRNAVDGTGDSSPHTTFSPTPIRSKFAVCHVVACQPVSSVAEARLQQRKIGISEQCVLEFN